VSLSQKGKKGIKDRDGNEQGPLHHHFKEPGKESERKKEGHQRGERGGGGRLIWSPEKKRLR